MAIQLQLRRGTTAENNAFTGAVAEVTVDTDTHELRVHDGSTTGGFTLGTKADTTTALAGKADKATTLAGYGIIDGATTSLNNLTTVGQNITNWSTNTINCVVETPKIHQINLIGGVLTFKSGSKVYVPNGFETDGTTPKFDLVTTVSDLSKTQTAEETDMLFVTAAGTTLVTWNIANNIVSGPTYNGQTNGLWYDTTNNRIRYTTDGGSTWSTNLSFPQCTYIATNGTIAFLDKVFSSFGYIGSTVFCLPGAKALVPSGKNTDGSLKKSIAVSTKVNTYTVSSPTNGYRYSLAFNGILTPFYNNLSYKESVNRNYAGGSPSSYADIGYIYFSNGSISQFYAKGVFHAVDYNDKDFIAHQAMPSSKYIDLTIGASGTTYTAPADGYFASFSSNMCNTIIKNAYANIGSTVVGDTGYVNMNTFPVKKGEVVAFIYSAAIDSFRFYYANGAA